MSIGRALLSKLLVGHCFDAVEWDACECGQEFPNAEAWAEHLAEQIDVTLLVIPRSDIVGTEYGWRPSPDDQVYPRDRREYAQLTAVKRGGEAVERPALPWSVIPLPEDGT